MNAVRKLDRNAFVESTPVSLSLRDPAGSLFSREGRMIRVVRSGSAADVTATLRSPVVQELISKGKLVQTTVLATTDRDRMFDQASSSDLILEHAKIPFVSYPYEWAPEMLYQAACLTLELAETLLEQGLGLKDATPFNVLFCGPQPIFVDFLSIEPRQGEDPIWLPKGQFMRTFLNPLAMNQRFHSPLGKAYLAQREGIPPSEIAPLLGPIERFLSPWLGLVTIPLWLDQRETGAKGGMYQKYRIKNEEQCHFILKLLFKRLKASLARLAPLEARESFWSRYGEGQRPYSDEQFKRKTQIVDQCLAMREPTTVLDIGCNTGVFSVLAAKSGARVVAVDSDPVVIGKLWRLAEQNSLDILPLVVDLANPTPSTGWNNIERQSFLQRAKGSFDLVLMLAVAHHMMLTDGIPLGEVLALAAQLTHDLVVFEFIDVTDPMFVKMARGRNYPNHSRESFEAHCVGLFSILQREVLPGGNRIVYVLKKRVC